MIQKTLRWISKNYFFLWLQSVYIDEELLITKISRKIFYKSSEIFPKNSKEIIEGFSRWFLMQFFGNHQTFSPKITDKILQKLLQRFPEVFWRNFSGTVGKFYRRFLMKFFGNHQDFRRKFPAQSSGNIFPKISDEILRK